jgi:GNAT superfamily N-acetyltransferase
LIHWLPPYSLEAMREHAVTRRVHAIQADSTLVGTFTTGTHGWKYDEHIWADRNHRALYLGKLAIRPSLQGAGIGSWCLDQVERQARDSGCQAVRFDAITAHTRLVGFYLKRGYTPRGPQQVIDPLDRRWDVTALEKILA